MAKEGPPLVDDSMSGNEPDMRATPLHTAENADGFSFVVNEDSKIRMPDDDTLLPIEITDNGTVLLPGGTEMTADEIADAVSRGAFSIVNPEPHEAEQVEEPSEKSRGRRGSRGRGLGADEASVSATADRITPENINSPNRATKEIQAAEKRLTELEANQDGEHTDEIAALQTRISALVARRDQIVREREAQETSAEGDASTPEETEVPDAAEVFILDNIGDIVSREQAEQQMRLLVERMTALQREQEGLARRSEEFREAREKEVALRRKYLAIRDTWFGESAEVASEQAKTVDVAVGETLFDPETGNSHHVVRIDPEGEQIYFADGTNISFDQYLAATEKREAPTPAETNQTRVEAETKLSAEQVREHALRILNGEDQDVVYADLSSKDRERVTKQRKPLDQQVHEFAQRVHDTDEEDTEIWATIDEKYPELRTAVERRITEFVAADALEGGKEIDEIEEEVVPPKPAQAPGEPDEAMDALREAHEGAYGPKGKTLGLESAEEAMEILRGAQQHESETERAPSAIELRPLAESYQLRFEAIAAQEHWYQNRLNELGEHQEGEPEHHEQQRERCREALTDAETVRQALIQDIGASIQQITYQFAAVYAAREDNPEASEKEAARLRQEADQLLTLYQDSSNTKDGKIEWSEKIPVESVTQEPKEYSDEELLDMDPANPDLDVDTLREMRRVALARKNEVREEFIGSADPGVDGIDQAKQKELLKNQEYKSLQDRISAINIEIAKRRRNVDISPEGLAQARAFRRKFTATRARIKALEHGMRESQRKMVDTVLVEFAQQSPEHVIRAFVDTASPEDRAIKENCESAHGAYACNLAFERVNYEMQREQYVALRARRMQRERQGALEIEAALGTVSKAERQRLLSDAEGILAMSEEELAAKCKDIGVDRKKIKFSRKMHNLWKRSGDLLSLRGGWTDYSEEEEAAQRGRGLLKRIGRGIVSVRGAIAVGLGFAATAGAPAVAMGVRQGMAGVSVGIGAHGLLRAQRESQVYAGLTEENIGNMDVVEVDRRMHDIEAYAVQSGQRLQGNTQYESLMHRQHEIMREQGGIEDQREMRSRYQQMQANFGVNKKREKKLARQRLGYAVSAGAAGFFGLPMAASASESLVDKIAGTSGDTVIERLPLPDLSGYESLGEGADIEETYLVPLSPEDRTEIIDEATRAAYEAAERIMGLSSAGTDIGRVISEARSAAEAVLAESTAMIPEADRVAIEEEVRRYLAELTTDASDGALDDPRLGLTDAEIVAAYEAVLPLPSEDDTLAGFPEGTAYNSVEAGGTIWESAKGMDISSEQFAAAWSNPASVTEIGGRLIHISDIGLVHPGDQVLYIPGEGGAAGRFIVEDNADVLGRGGSIGSDSDYARALGESGADIPDWLQADESAAEAVREVMTERAAAPERLPTLPDALAPETVTESSHYEVAYHAFDAAHPIETSWGTFHFMPDAYGNLSFDFNEYDYIYEDPYVRNELVGQAVERFTTPGYEHILDQTIAGGHSAAWYNDVTTVREAYIQESAWRLQKLDDVIRALYMEGYPDTSPEIQLLKGLEQQILYPTEPIQFARVPQATMDVHTWERVMQRPLT